jgi:hypothetical protein
MIYLGQDKDTNKELNMNSEKVQTIITNLIADFHNRIGGRAARKQYAPAKWQIEKLTELGLIEFMPEGFGHGDAKVVIEEAEKTDSAVMNAYGEGEAVAASALNQAIEEVETVRVINYEGNGGSQNLNDGSRSDSFTSGSRIVIEKSDDGTWKWYADGISEAGLLWESDDYDGFESADEAEQNARDYLETYDAE